MGILVAALHQLGRAATAEADALHAADADVLATLDLLPAMAHMHPALATIALDDLHDQQVEAHRLWATRFAAFLKSKGETDDLPSPLWPVSVPEPQNDPEPELDALF